MLATTVGIDDDGAPVGDHAEGTELPGGVQAWERLGVGHRCETWLAWSPVRYGPVVVKFPRPHQVEHPRARTSLRREVAALAGNLHPGLPLLFVDGTAADIPYLVFEHVDGSCLGDEILDQGPLDALDAARLGVQLLAAVRTVHTRGLVHVDIKPDNVMLRDGRPVLLDFGSARAVDARQPAGALIGSPGYAAPELEAGAPIATSMDVYGLGVTLHEVLTGEPTFDPDLPAGRRPAPASLPASDTASFVTRMLEPDPARRPNVSAALGALATIAAYRPAWAACSA